jgi:hypothetical protein
MVLLLIFIFLLISKGAFIVGMKLFNVGFFGEFEILFNI